MKVNRETARSTQAFRPIDERSDAPRSGKRRSFDRVPAFRLRWPETSKARFDLFDAWHDVAMQIVRHNKVGLHLMSAAKKVIRWNEGVIVDSNEAIASRAGYCSQKTISREANQCVDLGLLQSDFEWKRPGGGKFITVRRLWPSLPADLPEWIKLPESTPLSLDTRGPDLEGVSLDTRGPDPLDTRGPATIDHKEGGADAT